MVLEATEKMDFEVLRCDSENRTNTQQIKSITEDINMFDAMAAGAAADKAKAEGDEKKFSGFLDTAKDEFTKNKKSCAKERKSLKQKITVAESDQKVMGIVVGLVDCGDTGTATGTTLLQCVDTRTNRSWTEMSGGEDMKQQLKKLKDP